MGLKLPEVNSFCYFFTLKTGALIIGYLALVNSLLSISMLVTLMVLVALYARRSHERPMLTQRQLVGVYVTSAIPILASLCYFALSVLLIVGVRKGNPRYIQYFYIGGCVILILHLVVIGAGFLFYGLGITIGYLFKCAIEFYFLIVIRSARLRLIEEQTPKPKEVELNVYSHQQVPLIQPQTSV